jgi:hypothetical protein
MEYVVGGLSSDVSAHKHLGKTHDGGGAGARVGCARGYWAGDWPLLAWSRAGAQQRIRGCDAREVGRPRGPREGGKGGEAREGARWAEEGR